MDSIERDPGEKWGDLVEWVLHGVDILAVDKSIDVQTSVRARQDSSLLPAVEDGRRLDIVPGLGEGVDCLPDVELAVLGERMDSVSLVVIKEMLDVASLILQLEVGDYARVCWLKVGSGVGWEKVNL